MTQTELKKELTKRNISYFVLKNGSKIYETSNIKTRKILGKKAVIFNEKDINFGYRSVYDFEPYCDEKSHVFSYELIEKCLKLIDNFEDAVFWKTVKEVEAKITRLEKLELLGV